MRYRIIAATLTAGVALAACSSSTTGASGGGNPASTANQTAATGGATTGAAPTSAAATSAGGGGIAGGDYCTTIKGAKARLDALNGSNSTTFLADVANVVVLLEQIDAGAPSDIKPSWDLLVTKIRTFADTVRRAGITDKQLQNPGTLTPQQVQVLQTAGAQLGSADFTQATTKIKAEVKAACGVDISS